MEKDLAEIYYHVREDYKQRIIIDSKNSGGDIIFPKLEKHLVKISDVRKMNKAPNFQDHGIQFFNRPGRIKNFDYGNFEEIYNQEIENLLVDELKSKEVIVFDHTIRKDEKYTRPPARHAHVDYTDKSAFEQVEKYVHRSEREKWINGHFAILNTWRPIQNKVETAPLGFLLPKSVNEGDLIGIDLVYPQRKGEVMGCLYNNKHQWIYLSEMDPDELVLFMMFDNAGRSPVVHSAFDFINASNAPARKSIESRILVRF